jgi:hypothetical protein
VEEVRPEGLLLQLQWRRKFLASRFGAAFFQGDDVRGDEGFARAVEGTFDAGTCEEGYGAPALGRMAVFAGGVEEGVDDAGARGDGWKRGRWLLELLRGGCGAV